MRTCFVLILLAACSSSSTAPEPAARPPTAATLPATADLEPTTVKPTCIATWSIDHDQSVLSEQRSVGPHADDFQERLEAEYLDPDTQVAVETTRRFQIGGTPILWFNQAKTHAVVNAAVLTTLVVADPTRMSPGQTVEVGSVTELGLGQLGHNGVSKRELIEFLIRARAIATYWHIGAEVCLRSETDKPDGAAGYRAELDGVHTYFTNAKNTDSFAFSVELRPGGAIVVTGAALPQQP